MPHVSSACSRAATVSGMAGIIAATIVLNGCAGSWKNSDPGSTSSCCTAPMSGSVVDLRGLEPLSIGMADAASLRACDCFPLLPKNDRQSRSGWFDVCVHPAGFVYSATATQTTGDRVLDQAMTTAKPATANSEHLCITSVQPP